MARIMTSAPFGSAESHEKYARRIADWHAGQRLRLPDRPATGGDPGPSINELLLADFRHVQTD